MRPWQHRTEASSGRLRRWDLSCSVLLGRKVDGHVLANEERVEKHSFSALTCSRKRAELIGEPRHPSQAVEPRRDGMLDVTEDIAVLMFTNHYILGEP